jgi:hypothetical protein
MDLIFCKCGCGTQRDRFDNRGRERQFIDGHCGIKTRFQKGHRQSVLEKNTMWNGGKTTNLKGYILIKRPEHPRANNHGYIFEHIFVMEEYLGRYITKAEAVHHINKNVKDNRIENLMVMSFSEHSRFHRIGWRKNGIS